MASSQTQSSPDGPEREGASVRRAVSLGPAAAADPGLMPTPAARPSATPGRNETEGRNEEEEAARPAPDTSENATAPVRPATASGTAEEPAAAALRRPEPDAEASADGAAEGGATAGTGGTAASGGADEPPSGNPKKPLLAAAGIAGVVLLAVPLLIWATDDSEKKKTDHVEVAAGSDTLLDEEPLEAPKGEYAPAEPTPEPSTKKPSAKPAPVVKAPPPTPSSTPSREPEKTAEAEVVKEHQPPKLPPNTAAYAVQRLAASNPGRHICYRVHVKGSGWTAPVCDGATAGHVGKGRPITAMNIAVSGTKRVNGNEFVQKDGWTTKWSGAADGVDLVLGSAAANAPSLSGFTIGVEAGNVCQNHKLGERDWGGLACESPEGWIFGGSTEPQLWLEAVKFTV